MRNVYQLINRNAKTCFATLALLCLIAAANAQTTVTFTNSTVTTIPDNTYTGALASMGASSVTVSGIPAGAVITNIRVTTGITHTWVGDLIVKLQNPDLTVLGLMSRPGSAETTDDGVGGTAGASDNLVAGFPITFADGGTVDAETMGGTSSANNVCQNDGECSFFPNPGSIATPPSAFAGLYGGTMNGTWTLYVGDHAALDLGSISSWTLEITYLLSFDFCGGAIPLSCNSVVTGTTVGATIDGPAVDCGGGSVAADVWYTYVGTGNPFVVSLCGATNYDSQLDIYTGTCGSLTSVTCDDDFCGFAAASQVTIGSTLGVTYYIRVHGFNGAVGNFTLTMLETTPPTITCPIDVSTGTDAGLCSASGVVLGTATGSDDCSSVTFTNNAPPSYSLGVNTVTWTATDASGNFATCNQTVTVTDAGAPIVDCSNLQLFDNGPLVNSLGTGSGSANESILQSVSLGMGFFGFGHQLTANNRVADDFTITASSWTLNDVVFYAYQTGSSTTSTITAVNLRIWDGVPGAGGSNIVWGDAVTNVLTSSVWSGIYRVTETSSGDIQRPIMRNTVSLGGLTLPAGTYWLDWQTDGSLASGPWAPPVTINGQSTTGNALQSIAGGAYNALVDIGPQGLPFQIFGSSTLTYPNDPGVCTANLNITETPTYSDLCSSIASVSNDFNGTANASGTYNEGTTTVVWTVTDAAGNPGTCSFDVTVTDEEAPTIVCPADATISTDPGQCSSTSAFGTPATTDNCPVVVTNDAPSPLPIGTTLVTWTVTDNGGNTATCTQNVTVEDNELPTIICPADIVMSVDPGTCTASGFSLGSETTSDNCGVASTTNDAPSVFNVGTTVVTWTVTDNSGNTATCTQNVTISDNDAPVINCPADFFGSTDAGLCTGSGTAIGTASATDGCGVAGITNDATLPFAVGTTVVTWTATDVNGNTSTCTQNVTIADTENPTVTCPADVTTAPDAGVCTASGVALGTPTTNDNCGVASVTNNAPSSFSVGNTTVVWTVTDNNGNAATCSQIVTVTESLSITCPSDITVSNDAGNCSSVVTYADPATLACGVVSVNYSGAPVNIIDNATVSATENVTTFAPSTVLGAGGTNLLSVCYNIPHTWVGDVTVTLESPNGTQVTLINRPGVPASTFGCSGDNLDMCITTGTGNEAENACSNLPAISGSYTAFGGADLSSLNNGGLANGNWTLIVSDGFAGDVGQIVDFTLNFSTTATLSQTAGLASGSAFPVGTTTNTFVATDNNGNTSTCSFNVTVNDTEAPTVTCPADVTVAPDAGLCTASSVNLGVPTTNDNCGVASTTNNAPSVFNQGNTTVTWTVTDNSGNTATCTQIVTVTGTGGALTLTCPSDVTTTADAGQCSASGVNLGNPTVGGACGGTPTVTNNGPSSYPVGTTTVVWTADDGNGNTATCSQLVTVTDGEGPIITCPADITVSVGTGSGAGLCDAGVTFITPSVTDNCTTISSQSLSTAFGGGNGQNGNMFDVSVINNLTVTGFDIHPQGTADFEVYYKAGTHVGFETAPGAWTLLGSATGVTAQPFGTPTVLPLSLSLPLTGGQTYAFYITCTNGQNVNYTNGTAVGNVFSADANLQILEGKGVAYPFAGNFSPRIWNGTIHYDGNAAATVTQTGGLASGSIYPVGVTTNTFEATDGAGNTSTCSFTVTVVDDVDPTIVCPTDVTVPADAGLCTASNVNLGNPTTSDNCGVASVVNDAPSNFNAGNTTVTWTVTDNNGNTATCTQTVIVVGGGAISITCPADISIQFSVGVCDTTGLNLGTATTSGGGGCGGSVVITNDAPVTFQSGTTVVTWLADDGNGNTATCTQVVTLTEIDAPTIVCPADITISTGTGSGSGLCDAVVSFPMPTASDNCSTLETLSQSVDNLTITAANSVSCNNGFGHTDNSYYRVYDLNNYGHGPGNDLDVTGVRFGIEQATGNGGSQAVTVNLYTLSGVFNLANLTLVATQSVTITDQGPSIFTAPISTTIPGGSQLVVELFTPDGQGVGNLFFIGSNAAGETGSSYLAAATCGITQPTTVAAIGFPNMHIILDIEAGSITLTQTGGLASGSVFPLGTTVNTFEATDASGNTATCSFNVTVVDDDAPTIACPANVTVAADAGLCTASNVNLGIPTTADNCGVAGVTNDAPSVFNAGVTTVTWTVTDNAGNTATCTQTVTVLSSGVAITCPSTVNVNTDAGVCTAVVNYTAPVGTDACGGGSNQFVLDYTGAPVPVLDNSSALASIVTSAFGSNTTLGGNLSLQSVCFDLPHTWVGDVTVTLQAPDGTQIVLLDRPGVPASTFGCSGDDLDMCVTTGTGIDPESVCANLPAISGTYTAANGADLNSINNGSSPNGTWQLIASDVVGGDIGQIVTWSLTFGTSITTTQIAGLASGSTFPLGATTNTFESEDVFGNTATCSFDVTVTDAEVPTITCPTDVTVAPDAGLCSASGVVLGTPTTGDNCGVATTTNDAPSVFNQGNTTITWTVTDNSGNTATCTQIVTVTGTGGALTLTCPADVTTPVDAGLCTASGVALGNPTVGGGCGGTPTVTNDAPSTFPIGATTVTWTADDGNGNTATCTQVVTVTGGVSIVCPSNVSVGTDAGNCSAVVTYPTPSTTACGNVSVNYSGAAVAIVDNTTVIATENVTAFSPTTTLGGGTSLLSVCYQINHTWVGDLRVVLQSPNGTQITLLDRPGYAGTGFGCSGDNLNMCVTQGTGTEAETVCSTLPAIAGNYTAFGGANLASINNGGLANGGWQLRVTDNAGGDVGSIVGFTLNFGTTVTVTQTAGLVSGAAFPLGTTTNTFVASDGSGNTATCSFDVTVTDDDSPTITCPADLTVSPDAGLCTASNVNLGAPITADNCGVASVVNDAPSVFNTGNALVTWTVTDNNGNSTTCTQVVTVVDAGVTIVCPGNVNVNNDPGLCTALVNYNTPIGVGTCGGGSGIFVLDYTGSPVGIVDNTTVSSSETTSAFGAGVTLGGSVNLQSVCFQINHTWVGDLIVTLQSPDGSQIVLLDRPGSTGSGGGAGCSGDNLDMCIVTGTGNEAESVCSNLPAINGSYTAANGTDLNTLNNGGSANGAWQLIVSDNATLDAGSIVDWSLTFGTTITTTQTAGLASGSNFPVGTTTNTFEAEDAFGNTATCSFDVTVTDAEVPTITCPSDVTVAPDAGLCTASNVSLGTETTSDNCGVASVSNDAPSVFNPGNTTVTWTVTDNSGNTATCTQTVTVTGSGPFTITCPADVNTVTDAGVCSAIGVNLGTPTLSGGCGSNPTFTNDAPSTFPEGTTTVTWTGDDGAGNTATCTQLVTVVDGEAPVIACPSDITVTTGSGSSVCGASVSYAIPTATDNCSVIETLTESNDNNTITTGNSVSCNAGGLHTDNSYYRVYDLNSFGHPSGNDLNISSVRFGIEQAIGNGSSQPATVNIYTLSGAFNLANLTLVATQNITIPDQSMSIFTAPITATIPGGSQMVVELFTPSGQVNGSSFFIGSNALGETAPSYLAAAACGITQPATTAAIGFASMQIILDVVAGDLLITQTAGLSSGSVFPVGTTVNTYEAQDEAGNTSTCSFTVTVIDDAPPSIACPADITIAADAGLCTASNVNLGTPTTSDNCGIASTTSDAPAIFPVGATTVTWIVTDNSGNTATCTQTVTVVANGVTITCPGDITVSNDPGLCSAVVNYTAPVGEEACTGGTGQFTLNYTGAPVAVLDNSTASASLLTSLFGGNTTLGGNLSLQSVCFELPHTWVGDVTVTLQAPDGTQIVLVDRPGTAGSGAGFGCANDNFDMCVTTGTGNEAEGICSVTPPAIGGSYTAYNGADLGSINNGSSPNGTWQLIATDAVSGDVGQIVAWSLTFGTSVTTTQTTGLASGSTFPVGTTTNTFEAEDVFGNTASCSFDVIVNDTEAPTITCPADVTVAPDAGVCTASNVNLGTETTSDNCGVASVTNDAPSVFNGGSTTVTWTVTDNSGNTATCTQIVTVTGGGAVAITCPADVNTTVDAGQCVATGVNLGNPSVSGGCTGTPTVTNDAPSVYPVGTTTVTWTATDGSGNTATCTQFVIVTDSELPTITCAPDVSVSTDAGQCSVSVVLTNPTTGDNCGVASVTNNAPASFGLGTTTVTWIVTDNNGNTATCVQTVTVTDTELPTITCPADIALTTDAGVCTASGASLGNPNASDNCGVASVTNDAPFTYSIGTTTVTWTVVDNNGNTATCTQIVTVTDGEAPTITCPADISVSTDAGVCSASGVNLGTPTTNDNCGVASINSDAPATFALGTTTVTWTATDDNGNTATCTQTVTVNDTEVPTITCPVDIAVGTDANACTASGVVLGSATTGDNCGVASVSNDAPSSFALGTTIVTWTVADNSGNTATCTQTVTVTDDVAPVITCPAAVTVNVDANGCAATSVTLGTATATDNCGTPSVSNDAPASFPVGSTTVTWTAVDNNGNTSTCTQIVTVVDNIDPTLTCPANVSTNTDAGVCTATVALVTPTTGDNCSVASVTNDAPAAFSAGTTTVTWTVIDGSGNDATCTQTVTVTDGEAPSIVCPTDVTANTNAANCLATGVVLGTATPSDNCGIAGVTNTAPINFGIGSTTVVWTVTDNSGNTATCNQIVTVVDNVPPTITCPPAVSVSTDPGGCTASNVNLGTPSTFDNCSIASVVNDAPSVFPVGNTTVTWTATDINGNIATCTQVVTVTGGGLPTITCPPAVFVNADATLCTASGVALGTPTAAGNCGVATVANDAPSVYPVGNTTVTWTVTDLFGNTSSCGQTVTVTDAQAPTITCPADVTVLADASPCVATNVTLGTPTTSDNCGIAAVSNNAPAQYPVGNNSVTWTVADVNGNNGTCVQVVTVTPNVDVTVSSTTSSLTSNASAATYQWFNCTTGTNIQGATNASYSPTSSGSYAVIVTQNGCTDTSACINFTFTNMGGTILANGFKVYPNPAVEYINIETSGLVAGTSRIQLYDVQGRLVRDVEYDNMMGVYTITLENLASAMYELRINTTSGVWNTKVMKLK